MITMIVLFATITILMIIDYIRNTNKLTIASEGIYNCSLLFTIIVSSLSTYFIRGFGASTYLICALQELLQLNGKRLKTFFLIHFSLYMTLVITDIGIPNNWDSFSSLIAVILSYFAMTGTIYTLKVIRTEKEEVSKLNMKLEQYALEVEELTASKERSMMAQELHDSVGHSLMALAMHLEFAKKMCDTNPEKLKEILVKSEDIAKSSINNLREAVTLLKKEQEMKSFNASIDDIMNNFLLLNDIKINFNTNENLDDLAPIIKAYFYKTIKESITNSIKHGKATEINILISRANNKINLILTDNGIGCSKIIKSNGLLGIEGRTASLKGSVNYFSDDNFGFGIDICIPILTEET
ncbi:sensor histidine kinase [Clostridium sp. HBUAS56017]|uniref:sensor histidine kinase n=1 Tax=Clostridium sp. HBUAS56017 TaxID=2571128 RepID=UPI001FAA7913|nr:sensor histidine kinase [Clostridium sp. HBUAS56017]